MWKFRFLFLSIARKYLASVIKVKKAFWKGILNCLMRDLNKTF